MLEKTITAAQVSEFTFGANNKTGYNITTTDFEKFACFSSTEVAKIMPDVPVKIRYEETERNGFKNNNIKQVANADGTFDEVKASTGGRPSAKADPDKMKQDKDLEIARNKSIQRQVAAKEATTITLADKGGDFWSTWDKAYDHILTKLLEVK